MTASEAKELLLIHSFSHPDSELGRGFLGSLRPFDGHLKEENFHIMAAIRVLAPSLGEPAIDREVVGALWGICYLARMWGVHPDGMLRRNGLIEAEDSARLERWVDCISYATMILLGGGGSDEAFSEYNRM
jgi:hypothetical protein